MARYDRLGEAMREWRHREGLSILRAAAIAGLHESRWRFYEGLAKPDKQEQWPTAPMHEATARGLSAALGRNVRGILFDDVAEVTESPSDTSEVARLRAEVAELRETVQSLTNALDLVAKRLGQQPPRRSRRG